MRFSGLCIAFFLGGVLGAQAQPTNKDICPAPKEVGFAVEHKINLSITGFTEVIMAERFGAKVARSFQIVHAGDFVVEKQSSRLDNFPSFRRWQSPSWTKTSIALR